MEVKIAPQMSLMDKLKILADAAKYDGSCSSSGMTARGSGIRWQQAYVTASGRTGGAFPY